MNSNEPQYSTRQIEDENEHFYLSESLISWMENCKCLHDEHPERSLAAVLPTPPSPTASPSSTPSPPPPATMAVLPSATPPSANMPPIRFKHRPSSAAGIAWNLVRIFSEKQNSETLKSELQQPLSRFNFDLSIDNADELDQINGLKINLDPIVESDGSQGNDTERAAVPLAERFERAVTYAHFVSNHLVDLIKRQPGGITSHNRKYLSVVINNSLVDLEPILSSQDLDMGQKTILYASLLKCCSSDALEATSRLALAKLVDESHVLRNKPKLVVDLVQAISQFLKESRLLVIMVERLAHLYLKINGRYDHVWANFSLRSVPDELYLQACIEEKAPLALMIYFESQFDINRQLSTLGDMEKLTTSYQAQHQQPMTAEQIWSKFFLWLARLTQSLCSLKSSDRIDGFKLTTVWVRILILFEDVMCRYLFEYSSSSTSESYGSSCSSGETQKLDSDDQEKSIRGSSETELFKSSELGRKVEPVLSRADSTKTTMKSSGSLKSSGSRQPLQAKAASLKAEHKCFLSFIKQMISLYDSINSSGLWSYLKSSTKSEGECKVSVTALAIACFLADRALIQLNCHLTPGEGEESLPPPPAHLLILRDELAKLLRSCLSKLEAARRAKSLLESAQFIETLLESVQQHEKVQYSEGVQLMETYARSH